MTKRGTHRDENKQATEAVARETGRRFCPNCSSLKPTEGFKPLKRGRMTMKLCGTCHARKVKPQGATK